MKVKLDSSNALGLKVITDINPLVVAEEYEFNKPKSVEHVIGRTRDRDYRDRALERCIDARVAFRSTQNNFWNLCRKVIDVKCPYCNNGTHMTFSTSQSQTSDMGCSKYECVVCKCTIVLSMSSDGICIAPKEPNE